MKETAMFEVRTRYIFRVSGNEFIPDEVVRVKNFLEALAFIHPKKDVSNAIEVTISPLICSDCNKPAIFRERSLITYPKRAKIVTLECGHVMMEGR